MKKVGNACLIIFMLLLVTPVIWTIGCSFVPEEVIEDTFGKFLSGTVDLSVLKKENFGRFSWKQYEALLLNGPDYLFRFWRSVFLVIPIVIFQLFFSIPAAYAFSQTHKKYMKLLFFFYLFLFMVPAQVTVIPSYLAAKKVQLENTNWSIWLPGIFSGFSVYLLSRRMFRIPKEILEASRVDGAGEVRILTCIAIPLARAEIAACAILLFLEYWNMVEYPVVMFSDPLNYPLSVFLSRIKEGAIGISFAASVIYLLPAIFVFLIGEEYLADSFELTGEK